MLEAFSVDKGGFRVQACDENLLVKQGKPLIHVEICAINSDNTIYTVAYLANGTTELRVFHSELTEGADFQLALGYACEKLGLILAEVTTTYDW
jgi:hypothetical protein